MLIKLRLWREQLRDSLFWTPTLYVVVMAALGQVLVTVDASITDGDITSPVTFTSTVDATRVLLSTIAGATIAFAGVAFSIALLTLQLASSQFTPRLIQQLSRDKFDKRVIGFVVGTFAYCLIVLRAVRGPIEDGGTAVIPNLSVAVGLVFGLAAVLAVVAFINHAAHKMDVNRVLAMLTERSLAVIEERCGPGSVILDDAADTGDLALATSLPETPGLAVRSTKAGWVESIDVAALLEALPPGATAIVGVAVGDHVGRDVVLATVWTPGGTPAEDEAVAALVNDVVARGPRRIFDFDFRYGIRQLVDVALKAMSPGINDPTTAHEAIHRMSTVLLELLLRDLPIREHIGSDLRRVVLGAQPTSAELVGLGYDELRVTTAGNPTVTGYLLHTIESQVEVLESVGHGARADLLRRQARLIGEMAESTGMHPEDLEAVQGLVRSAIDGRATIDGVLGIGGDPSASTEP